MTRVASSRTIHAPFRPFFLLAAIDAIVGGAVWLPAYLGIATVPATEWHRGALLFGMVPAMLCGFLLTALPRWTRQPAASRRSVLALLMLWAASRVAFVAISPGAGIGLAGLFLACLSALAGRCVHAADDRRNVKIVLLLCFLSGAAVLLAASLAVDMALRMALAAIVGLLMVIGGRLVPALTSAYAEERSSPFHPRRRVSIERGAALAAVVALVLWVVTPGQPTTGAACAVAALAQALRTAQWFSWRSGAWAVGALHAGYGWIAAGFALLVAHARMPEIVASSAGIHAWMVGALGTTGIAVMSSMIRRHSGRAFATSSFATAASLMTTLACVARLTADLTAGAPAPWIVLSGSLWMAAFVSFLIAYGRSLARPYS